MMLAGQVASADVFDDCMADCDKELSDCVAQITVVNELEVEEAKAVCENSRSECQQKCNNSSTQTLEKQKDDTKE
jgi:hypothetical protein